jgi:putative DNA primase/helicase
MDATEAFAPLVSQNGQSRLAPGREAWKLVAPIVHTAPRPWLGHGNLGDPSEVWTYRDSAGAVLGYVCRFETAKGKELRPRTLWVNPDGKMRWRWASWEPPRPLYGLDRLASQPYALVILVEGEKAADAATASWPDYVAVSSPHGARSAHKADWSPLKGRSVTIWPEADDAGRAFARIAAGCCFDAGAANVRLVDVPTEWPKGWDLADELPDSCDCETLRRLA